MNIEARYADDTAEATSPLTIDKVQALINEAKAQKLAIGQLSDGYHTFDELYHHRSLLFMSLCLTAFKDKAWKSLLHEEGGDPMYSGMFIMGVETPYGQATYHYDIDPYWAKAKHIKELDHAPKFDGHTPNEAIDRILKYAMDMSKNNSITYRTGSNQNIEKQINTDPPIRGYVG